MRLDPGPVRETRTGPGVRRGDETAETAGLFGLVCTDKHRGMNAADIETLAWEKQAGLLPAIVQDAASQRVLMLGYMDRAALSATLATGRVTFFSRSRARLWTKGETSGNTLEVVSVQADCDQDALLVFARPAGPTCHRGTASCFDDLDAKSTSQGESSGENPATDANSSGSDDAQTRAAGRGSIVAALDALLAQRARERPEGSYTTRLFESGIPRIAQKVGEEGVETALAAVTGNDDALLGESADLVYHLLVLLHARGLSLADLESVLAARAGTAQGRTPTQ